MPCGSQIVLNNENRNNGVLGDHDWPYDAGFSKYHVVALGSDAYEAFGLETFDEPFIRDWSQPRHASAGAGETYVAC